MLFSIFYSKKKSFYNLRKTTKFNDLLISKEDSFLTKIKCNTDVKSYSTSFYFNLPVLKEQSEKTFIFFHDGLWEEEDWFRTKYCLKIMFALKKYQENNPQPSLPNSLMDANIIRKHIKLMLVYLKNTLVTDLDRINSKFLIFFYFLTKISDLSILKNKKKLILRNLFFAFIFQNSRLAYFFNLSNMNPIISKSYLFFKYRLRYLTSIFPQGFFLLLYSPYKTSFHFSSSNLLVSKQFIFFKRLFYLKKLLKQNLKFTKFFLLDSDNINFVNSRLKHNLLFSNLKFSGLRTNYEFKFPNKLSRLNKFHNFQIKKRKSCFKINKKSASIFGKRVIQLKKTFLISNKIFRQNSKSILKVLQKFMWRHVNILKLRIARLSFFFFRRFPIGYYSKILKLLSNFRFLIRKFFKFFNFLSNYSFKSYLKYSNLFFFIQQIFLNLNKMETVLCLFDNFYYGKKSKKTNFLLKSNNVFNSLTIAHDDLKLKIIKIFEKRLKTMRYSKIYKSKNFFLLLRFNFSTYFSFFRNLYFKMNQTQITLYMESWRLLNKFRFTINFLFVDKFLSSKRFLNIFSSYITLVSFFFISSQAELLFPILRYFPFFFHFNGIFSLRLKMSNNLSTFSVIKNLLIKYKFLISKIITSELKLTDFEALRDDLKKAKLLNLKFLRKNKIQTYIVERQNLRDLEFLTDSVKKFIFRLKGVKKNFNNDINFKSNIQSNKPLTNNYIKKMKKTNTVTLYASGSILNTKKAILKYLAFKNMQKRIKRRVERENNKIELLKNHIDPAEFFASEHLHRFVFMKNISKIDYKRKRKKFFINLLFFNKFVKEKRISVMFHKRLKGSHRISVFHKITNPFFLRLKLKRYFTFDKNRRTLNRFSYLNSSVGFNSFLEKMSSFSVLNFLSFNNQYFINHLEIFKTVRFFFYFLRKSKNFNNNVFSKIRLWLISLKIHYFSPILNLEKLLNLIKFERFYDYLSILKFFFCKKIFFFVKNFYFFLLEFLAFTNFFNKLKNFFIDSLIVFYKQRKKSVYQKFFSLNHNIFYNVLKYNYSKFYSTKSLHIKNITKSARLFKFLFFFNKKTFINYKRFFSFLNFKNLQSTSHFYHAFSNNNLIFDNFIHLYLMQISHNKHIKQTHIKSIDFCNFFKNLCFVDFFPFYYFSFFNNFLENSGSKLSFLKNFVFSNKFISLGFFSFFYSSLRYSYVLHSKSFFLSKVERTLKNKKLVKSKYKNYGKFKKHKNDNENSIYFLSTKKRIYKNFKFFAPNFVYHKFFPFYFKERFKLRKVRKKFPKKILFFQIPRKKITGNFFKGIRRPLRSKKKVSLPFLSVRPFSKKKLNFYNNLTITQKTVRNRLHNFELFSSNSKKYKINSNSISLSDAVFTATILNGSLLKNRINSIHEKYKIHPFKRLFYLNKYFKLNFSTGSNKLSSRIMVNLFYIKNLVKIDFIFINFKLQRYIRFLSNIFNQQNLIKVLPLNGFSSFSDKNEISSFDYFYFDYILFFAYIDIYSMFLEPDFEVFFFFNDYSYFDLFFKVINLISVNSESDFSHYFFVSDLFNFFFLYEIFFTYDSFIFFLNKFNFFFYSSFIDKNCFDLFYSDFRLEDRSCSFEFKDLSFFFFPNNFNFFYEFLKMYVYVLTYFRFNNLKNLIIPLNFLLSKCSFFFLKYIENLGLVKIVSASNTNFLIFGNGSFSFLNNFFHLVFLKILSSDVLVENQKLLSFLLNISFSLFQYNKFENFFMSEFLKKFDDERFLIKLNLSPKFFKNLKKDGLKYQSTIPKIVEKFGNKAQPFYQVQILNFLKSKKQNSFLILNKKNRKNVTKIVKRKLLRLKRNNFRSYFKRKLRRRAKRFYFNRFFDHFYDNKLKVNSIFHQLLLLRKVRSINIFCRSKSFVNTLSIEPHSYQFQKLNSFKYINKNRLEPFFRKLLARFRKNRVKLNKRHLLIKTKFHPFLKQRIFVNFFISPRFLNFKNTLNKDFFFQSSFSNKLKLKLSLFLKLNRFLEFITKLILKVKLFMRRHLKINSIYNKFFISNKIFSVNSFSNILKIYRKIKLLIKGFFSKLSYYLRKKRGPTDKSIIDSKLNFNLSNIRFLFFYNFLSLKFLKSFVLRYFFFGDYLKTRFQFINRYLWFRTVPLNNFLLTPKIYIIITKARNNFFLTAIDLFGRIIYKSSPGIVKFTGSDKMSKYAWFEASADFCDGFLEFFRYYLKSKKRKRISYSGMRIDREYNMRYNRKKKKFGAFLNPVLTHFFEQRKLKKKLKKRRSKIKIKLRRFFVISKGISDFNLRVFLKGMISERFYVSRYFAGAVNYPMRSFSLCRIKKVRRV